MLPTGRHAEGVIISELLVAGAAGPAVLAMSGPAGIGKTTLCHHAVNEAGAAGFTVVTCRPAQPEAALTFAALTDLLATVPDDVLDLVPAPQRHALGVATLRQAATEEDNLDERTVGTGLTTVLRALAIRAPVLVVVDDAQWLDDATRAVLGFALRRIEGDRISLLVSRRSEEPKIDGLLEAMPGERWESRIEVGPLSAADLFHIVHNDLGVSLTAPALARISDLASGNPFLAIELVRNGGRVPSTFASLTASRLSDLSPAAQRALLAVACSPRPTLALLDELGLRQAAEEAESAGIVRVLPEDGRIELAHPLFAEAAIELARPSERRAMHGRLAAISAEAEVVARHLALATVGPDEAVAAALDVAATSAAARGATEAATALATLAIERTIGADSTAAWVRRVRAAELTWLAGDASQTRALLDGLAERCPPGRHRCEAWLSLAQVEYETTVPERAVACADQALADATLVDDPEMQVHAHLMLAALEDNRSPRLAHAVAARAILEERSLHFPPLLAWAMLEEVAAAFHGGDGLDVETLDRALAIEQSEGGPRHGQVAVVRPPMLGWADRSLESIEALEDLRRAAEADGNVGVIPYALSHLPAPLSHLGRLAEARRAAEEHLYHSVLTAQDSQRIQAVLNLARVDALLGETAAATAGVEEVLSWARQNDEHMLAPAAALLGSLALMADDRPTARHWLERCDQALGSARSLDPGVNRYVGDLIEALIGTGALEEAESRINELAAQAERAGRMSAKAAALRCRGLLAAVRGDGHAALAHLTAALAVHDELDAPIERGRTLLAKGIVHRRMKQRRLAGEVLGAAKELFDGTGASAWGRRVDAELARLGRRAGPPEHLTPTELRVASLAASGMTNRQIAEQAFMSTKTVEANLSRIYNKLGIRSRAELGARMAQLDVPS